MSTTNAPTESSTVFSLLGIDCSSKVQIAHITLASLEINGQSVAFQR